MIIPKNTVDSGFKIVSFCFFRARSGQCNRMFQVNAPITSVCLHPNQGELIVADQAGCINIWDLKSDKTEQLVRIKKINLRLYILVDGLLSYVFLVA